MLPWYTSFTSQLLCSPLTTGRDAAAKSFGQHSCLLQSSEATSTQRTRAQHCSALLSLLSITDGALWKTRSPLTGGCSSSRSAGPVGCQGQFPLTCIFSPGRAQGTVLSLPSAGADSGYQGGWDEPRQCCGGAEGMALPASAAFPARSHARSAAGNGATALPAQRSLCAHAYV